MMWCFVDDDEYIFFSFFFLCCTTLSNTVVLQYNKKRAINFCVINFQTTAPRQC